MKVDLGLGYFWSYDGARRFLLLLRVHPLLLPSFDHVRDRDHVPDHVLALWLRLLFNTQKKRKRNLSHRRRQMLIQSLPEPESEPTRRGKAELSLCGTEVT